MLLGPSTFKSSSTFVHNFYSNCVHNSCSNKQPQHISVLFQESLDALGLQPGMTVVDCTLGLGGHSSAIMDLIGPEGHLYAFDRDERNIAVARERLAQHGQHFTILHDSFSSLKDRLKGEGVLQVDALLFDLGLSSPHLDDAERGFSFRQDGPLDMRFDASEGHTAADILHSKSESELADIFYHFGEIRSSRKLAAAVVDYRKQHRFERTLQLTKLVEESIGRGKPGKHNAVLVFQALRMAVNEELMALELGLTQAVELLAPHGRVVVLSYHSLEDRFVKHFFKQLATDLRDPSDPYGRRVLRSKTLSLLNKKPITPTEEEIQVNPRARSAKLRAAEKI